ncbi:MAG: hypothetical protein JRJ19_14835 [Deltaproteobacteria bacterium]|nr:hypothetical protein [Deltaproteobacteria bacterium]MBW1873343.1 hypothetical protein [Deltaproteobacteria bacterium]
MPYRILLIGLTMVVLSGCSSSAPGLPEFKHQTLYDELQECATQFLYLDGEWLEDFDDGAFYGPAFYAQAGETQDNQTYRDLGKQAADRNRGVFQGADLLNGDVNLIVMAALGMIEYMAATLDLTALADMDLLIDDLIDLVEMFGWYVPPEAVPGYAMETYGPTAINGLMVLLPLQRCFLLEGGERDRLIEFSEKVVEQINANSWNGNGSYYEFSDGLIRPGLFLYPNVTMTILNARLFQLTQKKSYKDRALAIYQGMQPLKVTEASGLTAPGRYRSPYSAEHMGAQTDNYSTLSSQNYLMLTLMLLYQLTEDPAFLLEIDPILDFIDQNLQGGSCLTDIHMFECDPVCSATEACLKDNCYADECHCGVLHHWMDERLALPEDPEFFCSGCNLQLLYIMWYRQNNLAIPGTG